MTADTDLDRNDVVNERSKGAEEEQDEVVELLNFEEGEEKSRSEQRQTKSQNEGVCRLDLDPCLCVRDSATEHRHIRNEASFHGLEGVTTETSTSTKHQHQAPSTSTKTNE